MKIIIVMTLSRVNNNISLPHNSHLIQFSSVQFSESKFHSFLFDFFLHFHSHPSSLSLPVFSVSLVIPLCLCLPSHPVFILLSHSLSQGPEVRIDRGEILTDWNPADDVSSSSSTLFYLLSLHCLLFLLSTLSTIAVPPPQCCKIKHIHFPQFPQQNLSLSDADMGNGWHDMTVWHTFFRYRFSKDHNKTFALMPPLFIKKQTSSFTFCLIELPSPVDRTPLTEESWCQNDFYLYLYMHTWVLSFLSDGLVQMLIGDHFNWWISEVAVLKTQSTHCCHERKWLLFTKFTVIPLWYMFLVEVVVKDSVVLDWTVLRSVEKLLFFPISIQKKKMPHNRSTNYNLSSAEHLI